MSEKEEEQQQLGKLWDICWRTRQSWLKGKKNQWGGGVRSRAIKHILREKRRWMNGAGMRTEWRAVKDSASGWDRQLLELACRITKGNEGQTWKWLCATSLLWRKETKLNPQALWTREDRWLRKIHAEKHAHTHTCIYIHTLSFPDCLKRPKFCVRAYVWVAEKRNCIMLC